MQFRDGQYLFSATDLVGFLECAHLTALDRQSLGDGGVLRAQQAADDPSAALIARKGTEHELAYLQRLHDEGRQVVDIAQASGDIDDKVARTLGAMAAGADVVFQATLCDGQLFGHADFLMRVDGVASRFGNWCYEVADTKLARSPKAKFLVQLAFYSHLLAQAQGVAPQHMHLVLGDQSQHAFRCADYRHYFEAALARYLRRVALLADAPGDTYPEPCAHCDLCHWRDCCATQRVADDHLCQVANISRVQWTKLQAHGITTMASLAGQSANVVVPRLHPETLERLRSQAVLQHRARQTGRREAIVLPLDPQGRRGFFRLPAPDEGDLFFDMEGDPLENGGLEYLFGFWYRQRGAWAFQPFWGLDRAQEGVAFEQCVDFIAARRKAFPGAHVYHYASYEETALKRLAGSHATREVAVDNLLREGVLVDLYQVVREALRISEPSYSIKYVERFYRPARAGDVQNAGASMVAFAHWRETQEQQVLQDIADYNRDDVESTQQLRDWLLTQRPADLAWGRPGGAPATEIASEVTGHGDGGEEQVLSKAQEAEQRLVPYRQRLVESLPVDREIWLAEHYQAELVYQLLDFHRRADKPAWWAMYARMDLTTDELIDDPECLGGLQPDPENPPTPDKRSVVYSYIVPAQETKLSDGDSCTRCDTGQTLAPIEIDDLALRLRIKVGPSKLPLPEQLDIGPGGPINNQALVNALYRFADGLLAGAGRYAALERLLRREPPRLRGRATGHPIVAPGQDLLQGSLAAVLALDNSHLYVQGPPGSGKTYTGARMIARLLADGKSVGIMSNSHKAINNLLAEVMKVAQEQRLQISAIKKCAARKPGTEFDHPVGGVENLADNGDVWASAVQLVAGTAWLFADERADQRLDVLFVDEAGQVALANLIAAGTAARNIVLLGDQMQLSQPVQGVHPGRSGDSALDYLLDGAATIAPDRGIFLATSYRMHPLVCRFISDAVYDGRLEPEPGNVRRVLVLDDVAHPILRPAGIAHALIEHKGCSQGSDEEVALVCDVYASAMRQCFTDKDGAVHAMTARNILVVAPYNVQVNLLRRALPADARVGTVDKFQGQEAELVIVSMTTSSERDLPRNIEFLYSKNRLNVAVSRAKCLAVVVANPELMAVRCQTPVQMALVNTLCWVAAQGRSTAGRTVAVA